MRRRQNDILLYVKSIAWVITPFCLLGSLHYLFVCFPRVLTNEEMVLTLNHLNFDYLGVIVGFFTLLVTLLVGWQIFNNIKERERIDKLTEANDKFQKEMLKFRDGLELRMSKMEKCCEERGNQVKAIDEKVDAHTNATLLVMSAEALMKDIDAKSKLSLSGALRVSIAYSSLLRAILQFVQTNGKIENIRGCVSKLKTCLLLFWDNSKFDKSQYDECDRLYNEINNAISEHKQYSIILEELKEANEWRKKIRWDEDAERMHEFFRNPDKEHPNPADNERSERERPHTGAD